MINIFFPLTEVSTYFVLPFFTRHQLREFYGLRCGRSMSSDKKIHGAPRDGFVLRHVRLLVYDRQNTSRPGF